MSIQKSLMIFILLLSVVSVNAGKKYKWVTTISPGFLETVKSSRPILKWKKYPKAKSYHLRWFEIDPVTRSIIKTKQNIKTENTEYKFKEDLVPNRVYQWQVEPCDVRGTPLPKTRPMCPSFLTGTISKEKVKMLNKEYKRKRKEIGKILGGRVRNAGPPIFIYGVYMTNIQKGELAKKCGLRDYDVITKCNEQPIKNINDLYVQINKYGTGLSLEFVRRVMFSRTLEEYKKSKKKKGIDKISG